MFEGLFRGSLTIGGLVAPVWCVTTLLYPPNLAEIFANYRGCTMVGPVSHDQFATYLLTATVLASAFATLLFALAFFTTKWLLPLSALAVGIAVGNYNYLSRGNWCANEMSGLSSILVQDFSQWIVGCFLILTVWTARHWFLRLKELLERQVSASRT